MASKSGALAVGVMLAFGVILVPGATWYLYPTLLPASPGRGAVTSRSNYLYFSAGVRGQSHRMARRWIAFGEPRLPVVVHLEPGGAWLPSPVQGPFGWACSGDVEVDTRTGPVRLYDDDPTSGLVTVLRSANEVTTIHAPFGATCTPSLPLGLAEQIQRSVGELLERGCASQCDRVRVVEIDSIGNIVVDREGRPARADSHASYQDLSERGTVVVSAVVWGPRINL